MRTNSNKTFPSAVNKIYPEIESSSNYKERESNNIHNKRSVSQDKPILLKNESTAGKIQIDL